MKTAIIGGGKGCSDILEMTLSGRLRTISMKVMCVVDLDPEAPGMVLARDNNILTLSDIETAVSLPGLDLIIEVTGNDRVLDQIHDKAPPGVRVMDHVLTRVFWDVEQADQRLREELEKSRDLENQLDRDRRELQEILDAMPDVVMVINRDRRIERVNARFEQAAGISRNDAEGMSCSAAAVALFGGDCEGGGKSCCFAEMVRTDKPVSMIRYTPPGDDEGEEKYCEITANPIRDDSGEIVRMVETSRQITEQVLLKRETEQSEQRFRQFLDAAHDMIVMKDMGGRYLFVNREAAAMLGKSPEDFIGRTDPDVLPAKLARRIIAADREVMEEKRHVSRKESLIIGGRKHSLDTVRFPLFDYKGDVAGVASISRDMTERESLQQELISSERLAAVGKLAAGVAHEINNPLTGILTFTESLLLESEDDDPRREDYEIIMSETMRCRQIVRDLLDYSRMEKPKREYTDFNQMVKRSVSLVDKQAEFHDIKFDYDLAPGLPDVSVDPAQIQQVILNLVINAKDAMKKKGVISLSTRLDESGKMVVLDVADHGCGIPPEKIKTVFEPFFTTKGAEGNGLGLPVVHSIIEQHGGSVTLDSAAGEGTVFHIALPGAAGAEEA